jgi:hypothetical protein
MLALGWVGCAEMGVSRVRRLLLSALVTLSMARCASLPHEPGATGTLDDRQAAAEILRSCHDALVRSAEPYGLLLAATSAVGHASTIWPIWVTTVYRRQGGPEKRTALINCHLGEDRAVVALSTP